MNIFKLINLGRAIVDNSLSIEVEKEYLIYQFTLRARVGATPYALIFSITENQIEELGEEGVDDLFEREFNRMKKGIQS